MKEDFEGQYSPFAPIDDHPESCQPIIEDCSSGVLPLDSSGIGEVTADGKRKIVVSEVTTINTLFFQRNKAMMTRYINEQLRNGKLARIVPFQFTNRFIKSDQREYKHVNFWQIDRTNYIADVEVHLKLDTAVGVCEWIGIMSLWGDIEKNGVCTIEDFVDKNDFDERDLTPLSSFLIPIYTNRQMDKEMECLWAAYLPEALTDPFKRNPYKLAERMGLRILRLHVYDHQRAPTILFFVDDTILVKDANSNSEEPPTLIEVPARTIVINLNHPSRYVPGHVPRHEHRRQQEAITIECEAGAGYCAAAQLSIGSAGFPAGKRHGFLPAPGTQCHPDSTRLDHLVNRYFCALYHAGAVPDQQGSTVLWAERPFQQPDHGGQEMAEESQRPDPRYTRFR